MPIFQKILQRIKHFMFGDPDSQSVKGSYADFQRAILAKSKGTQKLPLVRATYHGPKVAPYHLHNLVIELIPNGVIASYMFPDHYHDRIITRRFRFIYYFTPEEWTGEWGQRFKKKYPALLHCIHRKKRLGNVVYQVSMGRNRFGSMRLAREIGPEGEPLEFVLVKKIRQFVPQNRIPETNYDPRQTARIEYSVSRYYLKPNKALEGVYVPMVGSAEKKNEHGNEVIYQFIDISDLGNGNELLRRLYQMSPSAMQMADKNDLCVIWTSIKPSTVYSIEEKTAFFLKTMERTLTIIKKLHKEGLYHLNINPKNLLFSTNGTIRLTGFDAVYIQNLKQVASSHADILYWPPEMQSMLARDSAQKNINDVSKRDHWALAISLLQFYYGVICERRFDGTEDIYVFDPEGYPLAEYFREICLGRMPSAAGLFYLVNKMQITDERVKQVLYGLLQPLEKRMEMDEALHTFQEVIKQPQWSQFIEFTVTGLYQRIKKESAGN